MSGFFSANVTSPFPDQNALFDAAKVAQAGQAYQSNQLHMQGQQLDLTAADHEQVGRLAAGLLNEPDVGKRADLYSRGVGMLQSQGLAKYAPPTLPDEGVLRSLVSQAIPAADQYKLNLGQGAVNSAITALAPSQTSSAAPAGSVATAPSGTIEPAAFNNATAVRDGLIKRGVDPDTATALAANALHESVANPRTGRGDNGNSAGLFQWAGPRLQAYTDTYGHSPDGSPLDEQLDNVVRELKGSEATAAAKIAEAQGPAAKAAAVSQYFLRPKDTQGEMQRRSATALQLQQQIGGGATTATAAPATAQPGQPVPTQVAGPPMVSTAPPGSTAAPGAAPAVAAPTAPGQQPQAAPAASVAAVQPTAAPPAVPHLVTPSGQAVPPPPGGVEVLSNGLSPQQWGLVQSELKAASMGGPGAIAAVLEKVPALAAANRALNMQAWQAANPELKTQETSTGSILINPRTGQVVGSIAYQPNMQSRAVEGSATWDGSKWVPAVPGQPSVPGKWVYAGASRGDFQPAASQPPTASFDLQKELYKRDTEQLPEYNTQNQQASANQIRIQQMRELVNQVSSGAGGAERANWANIADTLGWHDLAKQLTGMGGAAAAQEFTKYGLATAGAQERGDLGARGSLGAISLYKSANPGLELQPDANKKMLTAQLVAAQANRDYTQQAMDYVNSNAGQFLHGGTYTPLSHFDAEWAAARNPQIYAAAMGAINGDPWDKWTKALNMKSPDDVQRVIGIVRRADPTSTVMWNNGQPHAVGTGQ